MKLQRRYFSLTGKLSPRYNLDYKNPDNLAERKHFKIKIIDFLKRGDKVESMKI